MSAKGSIVKKIHLRNKENKGDVLDILTFDGEFGQINLRSWSKQAL